MDNNRYALLIANEKFEEAGIEDLKAPCSDAKKLKEILENPEMGNFKCELIENKLSNEIIEKIEDFFIEHDKEEDVLLLYYAGHGVMNSKNFKLYLSAKNTKESRLNATAINTDIITNLMNENFSRSQIIIIDCCNSGIFEIIPRGETDFSNFFEGEGRVVFTSASKSEEAFEKEINGEYKSIYTNFLINGIESGEADINEDGFIDVNELNEYINREFIENKIYYQTPNFKSSIEKGNIYISKNGKKLKHSIKYNNTVNKDELQHGLEKASYNLIRTLQNKRSALLIDIGFIDMSFHEMYENNLYIQPSFCSLYDNKPRITFEDFLKKAINNNIIIFGESNTGKSFSSYLLCIKMKMECSAICFPLDINEYFSWQGDFDSYMLNNGILISELKKNKRKLIFIVDEINDSYDTSTTDKIKSLLYHLKELGNIIAIFRTEYFKDFYFTMQIGSIFDLLIKINHWSYEKEFVWYINKLKRANLLEDEEVLLSIIGNSEQLLSYTYKPLYSKLILLIYSKIDDNLIDPRIVLEKLLALQIIYDFILKVTSYFHVKKFNDVNNDGIFDIINNENIDIFIKLTLLKPSQAAPLLSQLPDRLKANFANKISTMNKILPGAMGVIERTLEKRISTLTSENYNYTSRMQSVVDILKNADRDTKKYIMEILETIDISLKEVMLDKMFIFEDIATLDNRTIQRFLREVENNSLAIALKGSTKEVQTSIFANMSRRLCEMIKEDIEFMGPVRMKDVEEAQKKIVSIIRKLEDAGEIIISMGENDEMIV